MVNHKILETYRNLAQTQRRFARAAKTDEAHDWHMQRAHYYEKLAADATGTTWETERQINEAAVSKDERSSNVSVA